MFALSRRCVCTSFCVAVSLQHFVEHQSFFLGDFSNFLAARAGNTENLVGHYFGLCGSDDLSEARLGELQLVFVSTLVGGNESCCG